jgi:small subunit ribosomal protein S4
MGQPKFSKKKYNTPNHPWKEQRIKAEKALTVKYGLKNKREIWKSETALRKYRGQARELLAKVATEDPQVKKEIDQLLMHLTRYNILPLNSTLDDVLALDPEIILGRRLQTLAYLKGLASTPKQARQLISHGHIAIDGRRVNVPGYRVSKNEENKIEYTLDSPLNDQAHPARPSGDFVSKRTEPADKTLPPQPSPSKEPVQKKEQDKPEQPKKVESEKKEPVKEEKPETPAKPSPQKEDIKPKEQEQKPEKVQEKKQEEKEKGSE